uniref:Uncharacterized protein n=1 Tax=Percolomonas cosmopolitus TaxID=63605 RepID=A0A6U0L6E0_9EUKA|mmetsp:Transcript_7068/g.26470  ORF Transcript_7068/g.26470 Transcript_7068/m.26470 type:complete len:453 (+) Transcript_7068:436-1794(+)
MVMDADTSHCPIFSEGGYLALVEGKFTAPFLQQLVFYFQDPEHLAKRMRNALYKSQDDPSKVLFLKGQILGWLFLIILFLEDLQVPVRAHLLRGEDVYLSSKSKMKTTHASNVFRPLIAMALVDRFGSGTTAFAQLIMVMHRFLSIFRSPIPLGFNSEKDRRVKDLLTITSFFTQWKAEKHAELKQKLGISDDKISQKPHHGILRDLMQNCGGLHQLWEEAREEGVHIIPRSISQNPVENLFALLRAFSRGNDNPTVSQCRSALSTIVHSKSSKAQSKSMAYESTELHFDEQDISGIQMRHTKLVQEQKRNIAHELHRENHEWSSKSFAGTMKRIAFAGRKKLSFTVKNDDILIQLTRFVVSVCNAQNIRELGADLPLNISMRTVERFRDEFIEQYNTKTSKKSAEEVLVRYTSFLATVCLNEHCCRRSSRRREVQNHCANESVTFQFLQHS